MPIFINKLKWISLLCIMLYTTGCNGTKHSNDYSYQNDNRERKQPKLKTAQVLQKMFDNVRKNKCGHLASTFPTISPTIEAESSSSPTTIAPTSTTFIQQNRQVINGYERNDQVGTSLALSGDGRRLAVGGLGVFYIYEIKSRYWSFPVDFASQFTTIVHDCAMSSDGNFVVAGETDDGTANVPGRAVVFKFMEPGGWVRNGNVLTDGEPGDLFGWSVDISDAGDKVIIGAPGPNPFFIIALNLDDRYWHALKIESSVDGFGSSVSLSADGKTVAVSATGNGGTINIYEVDNLISQNFHSISGITNGYGDGFGSSFSLSKDGSTIAVGSGSGNYFVVYSKLSGNWKRLGEVASNEEGSTFGQSLDLSYSGDRLIVGEKMQNIFYIFTINKTAQLLNFQYIDSNGNFGTIVSISGDGKTMAVGAPRYDVDDKVAAGKVGIFEFVESFSPTYVDEPTVFPSSFPFDLPSIIPTFTPSVRPNEILSTEPTLIPTSKPSKFPSTQPSLIPSPYPSIFPSTIPSLIPTPKPSEFPSTMPSLIPTSKPLPNILPPPRLSLSSDM